MLASVSIAMPEPMYRYHHTGIPAVDLIPGMVHIPHLHLWATDHEAPPLRDSVDEVRR
jgi:hypothetical protein